MLVSSTYRCECRSECLISETLAINMFQQQSDLNEVLKLINKKHGNYSKDTYTNFKHLKQYLDKFDESIVIHIQSVDYFEKKYSYVLLMNLISVVFIDIRIILNLVFKTAIISATLKFFFFCFEISPALLKWKRFDWLRPICDFANASTARQF